MQVSRRVSSLNLQIDHDNDKDGNGGEAVEQSEVHNASLNISRQHEDQELKSGSHAQAKKTNFK